MASLKPVTRDFIKESGKSTIYIRISHSGKTRYLKTIYEIEPKYMNADGTISGKYPGQAKLNLNLSVLLVQYNNALAEIGPDAANLDINTIARKLQNQNNGSTAITKYFEERIRVLRSEGRTSYAETYTATLRWMRDFARKDDIPFSDINLDFFSRLERWLLREGKKVNTVRIYLNNIKAVLNHARDNDAIKADLSFLRKFRVKKEKRDHRNLTADEIKKLRKAKLSPARQRSLDLFLLSYFLLGMNFKDLLYLKPENISKGRIEFLRSKTKAKKPVKQSVRLVPEAEAIFKKYAGKKYLLGFMDHETIRKTESYKDLVRDTSKLLKKICKDLGMDAQPTTYYARGSVATIANSLGVPKDTISEMLGHSFGNTETEGYIERNYAWVDKAQEEIIKAIEI